MTRGPRESTWLVLSRCLAIIRRVQRGPATWRDLVQAVRQEVGEEAYGAASGKALHRRVVNDLARIRERLGVEIRYSRQEKGYVIYSLWTPLLDLPDEDLRTIAWLGRVFDEESPYHDEVHALLERLTFYLGPQRAPAVHRYRRGLEMDLRQRDQDRISPEVMFRLERAVAEKRWVEFDYLSPRHPDRVPRRHRVAPIRVYFDASRGHYYLYGWCRSVSGPEGTREHREHRYYRIGRIQRLRVLPDLVPPMLPRGRSYPVIYELAPEIARMGVTRHPEITVHQVEQREDGSAIVRGETDNHKQVADTAFLIGALHAIQPDYGRVFLFASATPDSPIRALLERMGLPVEAVTGEPVPEGEGTRRVAQPLRLTFLPADMRAWKGSEKLLDFLPEVKRFLHQHPAARLVIILDSVADAMRLAHALREHFPDRAVGEVHGFSSPQERDDALLQPITVGTSTIELGVDFVGERAKDVLLFEARTSSQFIQRLGRIARHAKPSGIPDWAVALVPEYVYHFLVERLREGQHYDRWDLYRWIEEAY